MSESERERPPPGAISTSEYQIEEVIQNIDKASISLRSILPSPLPEEVVVKAADITKLMENSEKAVQILKDQTKKDIEYLIVGTIAGLILGIIGNLLVSVFIEICKLYIPTQTNLMIWIFLLVGIFIATIYVGWSLYNKIAKKRYPFRILKKSIVNKKNLHIFLHTGMMIVIIALVILRVNTVAMHTRDYNRLRYQINQRTYLNTNASVFIQPYSDSIMELVANLTGGWSNFSNWTEFWKDIFEIYSWVDRNIFAQDDTLFPVLPNRLDGDVWFLKDVWQYPDETLNFTKGDCEDEAILLCSMVSNYVNGRCLSECVLIASSDKAHVGVQIAFGVNITILDTALHYCTVDSLGNLTHSYVDSEIDCWIEHCSLGNDTCVKRVFSCELDKRFISSDEYLSWMRTRIGGDD